MKPIIIIKETNKEGKFELTEQELKDLIEQAYEQGFEEGRPKATLPQSQYDRPEEGILYRNINGGEKEKSQTLPYLQTPPHDGNGNPIPYCSGGTTSDPKDNRATLYAESNDLVYRGWEYNDKLKLPKQGEPIPCELNQTSSKPNPSITAWNNTTSNQSNEDTHTLT